MHFKDSFYEDEIVEGFYVPSMMKAAWGASLDVLVEVDRICQKHDIPYYADWGSLLGAIRHEGFVPWDDDLDICMRRKDYDRFLEYAKDELPKGFTIMNYKTREGHLFFVTRITTNAHICFEEDHLSKYHGFPYLVGLDLFILDNVNKDRNVQTLNSKQAEFIITVADAIAEGKMTGKEARSNIELASQYANLKIDPKLKGEALRIRMYELAESIFARTPDEEADALVQMMPYGMYGYKLYMDKKWFRSTVRVPFSDTSICLPVDYDAVMRFKYGDYMRVNRSFGGHNYPFFDGQHDEFVRSLDFEYPKYKASLDDITGICGAVDNRKSGCKWKENVREYLRVIEDTCEKLSIVIESETCMGNNLREEYVDTIASLCSDVQQMSVDLGNFLETVKQEGCPGIGQLENLCENIYVIYDGICNGGLDSDSGSDFVIAPSVNKKLDENTLIIKKLRDEIEKLILRREVVFILWKAEHISNVKKYIFENMEDENTDVYIMPIPYYYKKYDGTLRDEQFNNEEYKSVIAKMFNDANIDADIDSLMVDYSEFDISLHHPDKIYFQNPYDEWDSITSVAPKFYSSKLKKYTDKLVYVQYFKASDYTKEHQPEYRNMDYYVSAPGIINADEIIVPTESMKEMYIEKLCDFITGDIEKIREIFDKKIVVSPMLYEGALNDCENGKYADTAKGHKRILYYTGFGELDVYKMKAIDKIKKNLELLYENREKIELIWVTQYSIDKIETEFAGENKGPGEEVVREYKKVIEKYINDGFGAFVDGIDDMDSTTNNKRHSLMCYDAYYGDPSYLGRMYSVNKKPVMIQNYDLA